MDLNQLPLTGTTGDDSPSSILMGERRGEGFSTSGPWAKTCFGLQISNFGIFPFLAFLLAAIVSSAQPQNELRPPPPLDPAEGDRQARALVARLLSEKPEQASTSTGVLEVQDSKGNQRSVRVRFEIFPTPTNWLNTYEVTGSTNGSGDQLTIVHRDGQPNQYQYLLASSQGKVHSTAQDLSGDALMVPFAGSDFWLADLGLEFLHWPQQRVLKKQMRKGLSCDVLQSINAPAGPGGYSRVLSWIAINRPEDIVIVHAEAYDAQNKLLKEFDPKKVEKVNGLWQLEEMEIRNRQTGSRTKIEFNY
jgi:hypothetical protein